MSNENNGQPKSKSEIFLGYLNLIVTAIGTIIIVLVTNQNNTNLQQQLADDNATRAVENVILQNQLTHSNSYANLELKAENCFLSVSSVPVCFDLPITLSNPSNATANNVKIRIQFSFGGGNYVSGMWEELLNDISLFEWNIEPNILIPVVSYSRSINPAPNMTGNDIVTFTFARLLPGQSVKFIPSFLRNVPRGKQVDVTYEIKGDRNTSETDFETQIALLRHIRWEYYIGHFDTSVICENCEGDVPLLDFMYDYDTTSILLNTFESTPFPDDSSIENIHAIADVQLILPAGETVTDYRLYEFTQFISRQTPAPTPLPTIIGTPEVTDPP